MLHYVFHIFHINISLNQWKLISDNIFHKLLKRKPCVGAKLVLRFQALIAHASRHFCTANRHVHQDQYPEHGFGAIVSYFVGGDIFIDSPCTSFNWLCIYYLL